MAAVEYRTRRAWSDDQLKVAMVGSTSWSQVVKKLGLRSASAGLRTVPKHAKRLGLDTSLIVGRGASGNRTQERLNKKSLDEILIDGTDYNTARLKKRLLDCGLLIEACSECGVGSEWNEKKLTLQLDHRNGRRHDNRLENLRLLCPNCHSQTPTYAGRNIGKV